MNAIRAFINEWLKVPTLYCNNCGMNYFDGMKCCDDPQIGNNRQVVEALILQNKDIRNSTLKDTAASLGNNMRFGISMPPKLLNDLERYFKQYNEKLFNNKKEMRLFMKHFPMFCIPEKI